MGRLATMLKLPTGQWKSKPSVLDKKVGKKIIVAAINPTREEMHTLIWKVGALEIDSDISIVVCVTRSKTVGIR